MRSLERELQRRRDRFAVRLEVSTKMPEKMLKLLMTGIGLIDEDVERIEGFVDIPDLMQLYSLDRPDLKDKPIQTMQITAFHNRKNVFEAIKRQDILLHKRFFGYETP